MKLYIHFLIEPCIIRVFLVFVTDIPQLLTRVEKNPMVINLNGEN